MAVPVRTTPNRAKIDIGASVPLFSLGAGAVASYMVSRDGQRFLLNQLSDPKTTRRIGIILNWKAKQY
jgi:hypothetical protein